MTEVPEQEAINKFLETHPDITHAQFSKLQKFMREHDYYYDGSFNSGLVEHWDLAYQELFPDELAPAAPAPAAPKVLYQAVYTSPENPGSIWSCPVVQDSGRWLLKTGVGLQPITFYIEADDAKTGFIEFDHYELASLVRDADWYQAVSVMNATLPKPGRHGEPPKVEQVEAPPEAPAPGGPRTREELIEARRRAAGNTLAAQQAARRNFAAASFEVPEAPSQKAARLERERRSKILTDRGKSRQGQI